MNVKIETVSILSLALIIVVTGNVFAGVGARNISTQGATAYLSGGGRYTETEDADTVLSNPAGAAFMENGLYFHFSTLVANNQWGVKDLDSGDEYEVESLGIIPGLAVTYKKNDLAGFFTISFPGGNGGGSYDKYPMFEALAKQFSAGGETVSAIDQKFEYSGGKGGLTFGAAYKINDMFSVGYGIRAVYYMSHVDAKVTFFNEDTNTSLMDIAIKQDTDGWGLGHSFCFLFKYDKFKFGARFDPEVQIETTVDKDAKDNTSTEDGFKENNNLPPVIFTGASYQLTPKFKFGGGYIYYFQKGINGDDEPITEDWDNAWEAQAFAEFALSPQWELLTGINFAMPGIPNNAYTLDNISFADAWTFSAGTQYRPFERWTFISGLGYAYYPNNPKTEADPMGLYERQVNRPPIQLFLGFEYKL